MSTEEEERSKRFAWCGDDVLLLEIEDPPEGESEEEEEDPESGTEIS